MWELLELYLIGCVGTVVWVVNAEIATMLYGASSSTTHPLMIGLAAALGQCTSYLIFLRWGSPLVARFAWVKGIVSKTETRYGERIKSGFLGITIMAAVFGIPPVIGLILLAKPFRISGRTVIAIAFLGRFFRFTLLAVFGEVFLDFSFSQWLTDLIA